ncbi:MAG: AAA family ATPase [Actinomycetota bacterium]
MTNGNGVQTPPKAVEPGAERDFGRMANPLAGSAYRARAQAAHPHQSYAQVQRFGDNGQRHAPARPAAYRPPVEPPAALPQPPAPTNYVRPEPAPARVNEAESRRFNEELLAHTESAESFTDYRTLRRAVDEATHPSYAPDHQAQQQAQADTSWSTVAAEADYEEDEEQPGPRILVIDRSGDFAQELAEATVDLEPMPEILRLSRSTQVIEVVDQEEPDILVLAPEEMTGAGLKRVASVHRAHPEVVIVLSQSDKDLSAGQIAAAGTEDPIPANPSQDQLRERIATAVGTKRQRHAAPVEVYEEPAPLVYEEPVQMPSFMQTPRRAALDPTKLARVFTVASASGGCGKTFYSTNLAAYLSKATGGKVLLVDLDLQFGEVAISLHLRPKRTIAELVEEDDISAALSDYVVGHSGDFQVLCAPRDPIAGEKVGPREVTAVLEAAIAAYDYVVVDTPPSINETVLAAFDLSQSLVLLATMDLPSLKNLRVFLETLKKLNLPADQISVIVNKAESGTGIDLKEIEPLYPQGFSAVLPYAKQVSWSINMGVPVLMADPDSDISRKFVAGAVKLAKPNPGVVLPWSTSAGSERRGWFSRRLKGKA